MTKSLQVIFRKIIYTILVLSLLLSIITTASSRTVLAQQSQYVVYLPLVSKNNLEWLNVFNQYRKAAGLNPVVANDSMTYGLSLHVKYMLLNPDQDDWHTEYPGRPGYTSAGELAANQSNMLWTNNLKYTEKQSIDLWMGSPGHRALMLNPDLVESGFYLECNAIHCFAGLNVLGGIN